MLAGTLGPPRGSGRTGAALGGAMQAGQWFGAKRRSGSWRSQGAGLRKLTAFYNLPPAAQDVAKQSSLLVSAIQTKRCPRYAACPISSKWMETPHSLFACVDARTAHWPSSKNQCPCSKYACPLLPLANRILVHGVLTSVATVRDPRTEGMRLGPTRHLWFEYLLKGLLRSFDETPPRIEPLHSNY
jgi:hypothetical protein